MLPIFRSNYSLTSILTLEEATEKDNRLENRSDSVFDVCKDYELEDVFIVDNTLTGLVEAYENAKKAKLNLRFGYRVNVCQDISNKTPESKLTESKFIVFATKSSFADLIKLHNISSTEGIYEGIPRLDFKTMKEYWGKNLSLVIPFTIPMFTTIFCMVANAFQNLTLQNRVILWKIMDCHLMVF